MSVLSEDFFIIYLYISLIIVDCWYYYVCHFYVCGVELVGSKTILTNRFLLTYFCWLLSFFFVVSLSGL
jgi:hypothetical protein